MFFKKLILNIVGMNVFMIVVKYVVVVFARIDAATALLSVFNVFRECF